MQRVSPTSRLVEQAINLLIVTSLFGTFYALLPQFLGTDAVLEEWEVMNERVASLSLQNDELRSQNQRLLREVESLAIDELSVEQRAREDWNMVYPNELVIDLGAVNLPGAETLAPSTGQP